MTDKEQDPREGRRLSQEELDVLRQRQAVEDQAREQHRADLLAQAPAASTPSGQKQQRHKQGETRREPSPKPDLTDPLIDAWTPPTFSRTRALTEGAILAAVAAVLGIGSLYLPVVGMLLSLVWPLPLTLLVLRHGMATGLMGAVITGILLSFFMGPVQGLLMVVNMAGVGLCFGYCFRKRLPAGRTLFLGSLIAASSVALSVLLSGWIAGLSWADFMAQCQTMLDEVLAMYQQAGILETLMGPGVTLEQFRATLLQTMETVVPAAFVTLAMATAVANYFISKVVLRRLGYPSRHLLPFREWQMPWQMLWGLIAGLGFLTVGGRLENVLVTKIGVNILYVVVPILVVFGFALFVWLWKQIPATGVHFMMIAFLLFTIQYVLVIFSTLGLADSIFDLRAFFRKKVQQGQA